MSEWIVSPSSSRHRTRLRNTSKPQGRAVTLVELLMAMAVGLVVLSIVWELFRMSDRLFHSSRKRLTSLQGAFLLMEKINQDFASAVVPGNDDLRIGVDRRSLDFLCFDARHSRWSYADPELHLVPVHYRFDSDKNVFYRSWDGEGEEPFTLARFEVVLFAKPRSLQPPVPSSEHVAFRITCAADDDIEANRGKGDLDPSRRDRQVVTLISVAGLDQRAGEDAFPWWNRNPLPRLDIGH